MEALKHAGLKHDRLDALVVAAEVTMGGLTRDLNTERRRNTSLKTHSSEVQSEVQDLQKILDDLERKCRQLGRESNSLLEKLKIADTAAEVARQTALVTTSSLEKKIRRSERNLEQESKEKHKLQRDLKDKTKCLAGEKSQVMALLQVCALTLIHMHCFIMFMSFLCSIMSHQVMKQAQTAHGKEMNIMTQKHVRLQD